MGLDVLSILFGRSLFVRKTVFCHVSLPAKRDAQSVSLVIRRERTQLRKTHAFEKVELATLVGTTAVALD